MKEFRHRLYLRFSLQSQFLSRQILNRSFGTNDNEVSLFTDERSKSNGLADYMKDPFSSPQTHPLIQGC
jgi:hypothetical protein